MTKNKSNTIRINLDATNFGPNGTGELRLVVGKPFYTRYFKDGSAPVRFDLFDDEAAMNFLEVASIKGKGPSTTLVHKTPKNTFVWEKEAVVVRWDTAADRVIRNSLKTEHGKELARAMLRAAVAA